MREIIEKFEKALGKDSFTISALCRDIEKDVIKKDNIELGIAYYYKTLQDYINQDISAVYMDGMTAIGYQKENKQWGYLAEVYLTLGDVANIQDAYFLAMDNYINCLSICEEHGINNYREYPYLRIADLYAKMGNYYKAREYLSKIVSQRGQISKKIREEEYNILEHDIINEEEIESIKLYKDEKERWDKTGNGDIKWHIDDDDKQRLMLLYVAMNKDKEIMMNKKNILVYKEACKIYKKTENKGLYNELEYIAEDSWSCVKI